MPENVHECDLFLLTSHNAWNAEISLESFARIGRRNINGWGIGFYRDGISRVVRSEIPAAEEGTPSREFMAAIKAVSSDVILGHLRKTTRGANIVENNHPFKLNFLGYDWLMIHNGTGYEIQNMIPPNEQLLVRSTNDSARTFEYLRKEIIQYCSTDNKKSLIFGVKNAFTKLLQNDPEGLYNIILSNGYLTWCLVHWRPFYLLKREKDPGNVSIISTIQVSTQEEYTTFVADSSIAKMLVFSGHSLVHNGDII